MMSAQNHNHHNKSVAPQPLFVTLQANRRYENGSAIEEKARFLSIDLP
jgi:hypothetical protein